MRNATALIALILASLVLCARDALAAKPNILFIFCDDLTTQAISAYGDSRKLLNTPGMDRIAREGMRFDRCLVTNSICGPMRAVIQTGKYSHRNGFYNNSNSTFDSSQVTFPKLLKQAGYHNAVIGKWHLISDPVGFDHWHILPGQGAYYNPPMIANGKPIKHEGYTTDIITELGVQWLRDRPKDKPFMLMLQHKAPHREWEPPLHLLGHDKDRVYPEPDTLFDEFEGRSLALRDHDMGIDRTMTASDLKLTAPRSLTPAQLQQWNRYYQPRNEAYLKQGLSGRDLVRWRYQRYMHDYTACVKAVDESVQRVLAYLDESGLAENTVVILSSDQGFYLGEHGWFDKRWIFEESLRTPMMVRWPKVTPAGSSEGRIVSLLDLAQTFLDIAEVPQPADMQGRSLLPLLKGQPPADWRKSFYYHYYEFPVPHRVRPHYGVITERYKLIHYYGPDLNDWELLDRAQNPQETRNFYTEASHQDTVAELKTELARLQKELGESVPPPRFTHGNQPFDNEPEATRPKPKAKGKSKGKGRNTQPKTTQPQ